VRQVQGRSATLVNLAPATTYKLTVAAVDRRGYLGGQARSIAVSTAMPPATDGRAHAFLLATTDASFHDLQRHYRQIGTIYPTYYECRSGDGAILGVDDPLVTRWSKMRKIKVLPRFDCQRPSTLNRILNDMATRTSVIEGLAGLVQTHGYDGINIDFEAGYATDRDALSAFTRALAARLHPLGAQITIEVSPKNRPTTTGRSGFFDYPALAAAADHVFVMNWGYHWSTSEPGAPDYYPSAKSVADYVATMPHKSKWVLGTNLYGMDWPNGGGPGNVATAMEFGTMQALIARVGARPAYDSTADSWHFEYTENGVHHEVWFSTAATIGRRIQLAADRGLGIGFWRLGEEDEAVWADGRLITSSIWPQ
jgi:spore germination protein YaaH